MASNNNQHATPAAGVWTESRQQAKRGKAAAPMGRDALCCGSVTAAQGENGVNAHHCRVFPVLHLMTTVS